VTLADCEWRAAALGLSPFVCRAPKHRKEIGQIPDCGFYLLVFMSRDDPVLCTYLYVHVYTQKCTNMFFVNTLLAFMNIATDLPHIYPTF